MDQQEPVEFILDVFADPRSVRDVVKGILHTIFFNRYFPSLTPQTRDVLDLTLPYVTNDEIQTLIDQRASALERHLDAQRTVSSSSSSPSAASKGPSSSSSSYATASSNTTITGSGRSPSTTVTAAGLTHGVPAAAAAAAAGGGTSSSAATAAGGRGQVSVHFFEKRRRKAWLSRGDDEVCWECWTLKVTVADPRTESERAKVRRAMEQTLLATTMKIVTFVNANKDHIPPITTQSSNPFPYKINVDDHKDSGWASRMRIY